jgi:hypothetical protein
LAQSIADAILDQGQALLSPGPVALQKLGDFELEDRRLHRTERGKHPCDRARPCIGNFRQQARMVLGDMEDYRACLEQGEIAFLIGGNLAERMKGQVRGFLHRTERNEANLVGLADFFECPANARIARQSLAAIGRPFKRGNDDGHRETSSPSAATIRQPTAS